MLASWRTVRVFISSTFRDMQAERDHLVRFVFPRLREQLLPRRIHLVDVDLRWGVTSEQDASEVCREIINECRPRFLCMLGGRYGTIPEGNELSITADEVHFGALDALREKIYALFYFRNGAVTELMDKSSPGSIREPRHTDKAVKLARLKRDIRKAKHQPYLYRPQWNAAEERLLDLKAFGDRVERDILATIDDEFGVHPPAQLDEFDEENAAMEAFVEERSERFVLGSREAVLEELLAHASATGGNSYVCLTGAPGSGKSALLAHLSRHATVNAQPSTLLIRHFVGASPGSTDVRRTLRRLCHDLKEGCPDITADVPDDPEKLRVAFPDFLKQACKNTRVVILIDAISQFDPTSHSTGLHWLPQELPVNAHIILSSLEGPAMEELRRWPNRPREIELKPLTAEDGEAIIEKFRKRYRKKFEPDQRAALLAKADASIPLYLLAALEELRTLGIYEEITARIAELPHTTHGLFAWILERLENDAGFRDAAGRRVGRDLVSQFAALLCASRHGLSQRELIDLLDPHDSQGNVAALLHLLRPYLMHRGELLDFYHGEFRTASERAWLKNDAQRQATHAHLAAYFGRSADPRHDRSWNGALRPLVEFPNHLAEACEWKSAIDSLSDPAYLQARIDSEGTPAEVNRDIQSLAGKMPQNEPLRNFATGFAAIFWQQQGNFVPGCRSVLSQLYPLVRAKAMHTDDPFARWVDRHVRWMQELGKPWLRQLDSIERRMESIALVGDPRVSSTLGHRSKVNCLAVSESHGLALTGADDGDVILWDLAAFTARALLREHRAPVLDCCFSCDAKIAATADSSGRLVVWQLDSSPLALKIVDDPHSDAPEIFCCAISPDTKTLAYGRGDGYFKLIPLESGGRTGNFVFEPPLDPNLNRVLARAPRDQGASTGALPGVYFPVTDTAFFPSGERLLLCSRFFRSCERRVVNDFELEVSFGANRVFEGAALSCNGRRIVAGTVQGRLLLFDPNDAQALWDIEAHDGVVRDCSLTADGRLAVSAGEDDRVRLWDTERRREIGSHLTSASPITCCRILSDGRVLSGTYTGRVHFLTHDHSSQQQPRPSTEARVACVALNASCGVAVSAGDDGHITRWEVGEGLPKIARLRADAEILSCAVRTDGRQSAFGTADGRILFWNHQSNLLRLLGRSERSVVLCNYQQFGSHLLAADDGGEVTLWDPRTGRFVWSVQARPHSVLEFAIRCNGQPRLHTRSDQTFNLYEPRRNLAWWGLCGRIDWLHGEVSLLSVANPLASQEADVFRCLFPAKGHFVTLIGDHAVLLWSFHQPSPSSAYVTDDLITCVAMSDTSVLLGFRGGAVRCFAIIENLPGRIPSFGRPLTQLRAAIDRSTRFTECWDIWSQSMHTLIRSMAIHEDPVHLMNLQIEVWTATMAEILGRIDGSFVTLFSDLPPTAQRLLVLNTPFDPRFLVPFSE